MSKRVQSALLVALVGAGIGLIVFGAVLMWLHQGFELDFQNSLLRALGPDYHWRAIGDGYLGLGAVIAGAILMTVAATVALSSTVRSNGGMPRPRMAPAPASVAGNLIEPKMTGQIVLMMRLVALARISRCDAIARKSGNCKVVGRSDRPKQEPRVTRPR